LFKLHWAFGGYCVGVEVYIEPCKLEYFSIEIVRLLRELAGSFVDKNSVKRYIKRSLLNYMHEAVWRLMVKMMLREVA
jgi:hypothetical protein